MEIVMITSEAVPFAKTGGLADVCGSLPRKLAQLGHRCSIFMPAYAQVFHAGVDIQPTHVGFALPIAGKQVACRILKARLGDGPVDFYFVDQPHYYDRSTLYGDAHGDYRDNCERFSFLNRASLMAIESLHLPVQILHCHDWQTGLAPAIVKTNLNANPWFSHCSVIFTIHNMAYQGRFWAYDMPLTGIDHRYFNYEQMEFYGDINLLKTGIVFSDRITTVSPTYAQEIQTPEFGCGLESVLYQRRDRLMGIVNGVDYQVWDPIRDESLPQTYSVENWRQGKAAAKQALQKELGLEPASHLPVIGLIGRLAEQKGWDLVVPLLRAWSQREDLQWVILGSGEARFQEPLNSIRDSAPHRIAFRSEFSEPLAHRIEAASDIFLMPSRYEPCGLNQLYSLRYGTVPIVHAVGGLADTVIDCNETTLADGTATGFAMHSYDVESLARTMERALRVLREEPHCWQRLIEVGMTQDWSWGRSAQQYELLYQNALQSRNA